MLEHEHPQPEMEASSAADAQNTRKGLRGQAQQSQLHSRRLIQQAKELCARAERLDVEAAQLTGGTARPTPSMPPPSTPGRRDEARRARETDRR
jgi:hypothetical protein